jgi:hypothetical protein
MKIDVQKPVAFLYNSNEQAEKEMRKMIPFPWLQNSSNKNPKL